MVNEQLDIIERFKQKHNVLLGVCDAEPFLVKNHDALNDIPFSRFTAAQRCNPRFVLSNAESIIVIGVGYGKKYSFQDDDKPRGILSSGAIGIDYHIVVKSLLEELKTELFKQSDFQSVIQVDTGAINERSIAVKAGLGFIGKNGNVISKKLGSFFNIGCLITTIPILNLTNKADEKITTQEKVRVCGNCNLCIDNCPGGALKHDGFDYRQCVSFLTQTKKELTDEEKKKIGWHIYGCDICQSVCPYNKNIQRTEIFDIEEAQPELLQFITLDDNQFRKYEISAMYWRGRKVLQRNAKIALENKFGIIQ